MLLDNLDRAKIYNTADVVDYVTDEMVTGRIITKTTGSVTLIACDAGVKVSEKISPFDTLLQVIEGSVDVMIERECHHLTNGQCIIVPAHFRSHTISGTRYKMLLTIIKSGYEDNI